MTTDALEGSLGLGTARSGSPRGDAARPMARPRTHLGSAHLLRELVRHQRDADPERPREALSALLACITALGAADSASVLELMDGTAVRRTATEPSASSLDELQVECGEGPAIDAAAGAACVTEGALLAHRWRSWGPMAEAQGVAAVIAVPVTINDRHVGVLTLYHRRTESLAADDLQVALGAADVCAIHLAQARHHDHLWQAVDARHTIGRAQGILMERFGIDTPTAFGVLRRLSQDSNTKLALVATRIVETRVLPSTDGDPAGRTAPSTKARSSLPLPAPRG